MISGPPGTDRRAVHDVLLAFAGRLPDDELAVLRTCLADDDRDELVDVLSTASSLHHFAPAAGEIDVLRQAFPEVEFEGTPAENTPVPTFEPGRHDETTRRLERVVVAEATRSGGMLALWRADRIESDERALVLFGEASPGCDVVELVADVQHAVAEAGYVPRIEIFTEGSTLPAYHEAALDVADLVWQEHARPGVRLVRAFDGVDPVTGPFFHRGHPELDGEQRIRVTEFLTGAPVVLRGPCRADDIVTSRLTNTVPVDFRSDGVWVWPDTIRYYLEKYGLAPEPDLVRHALAAGPPTGLSRLDQHRVHAVLSASPTSDHSGTPETK